MGVEVTKEDIEAVAKKTGMPVDVVERIAKIVTVERVERLAKIVGIKRLGGIACTKCDIMSIRPRPIVRLRAIFWCLICRIVEKLGGK